MMLPTGSQFEIEVSESGHSARAVVTELASSLRVLEFDGVPVIDSYREDSASPMASGIVLVPWPNRVAEGRWNLHGKTQQLDITEPELGNAIHGLLRYSPYRLISRTASSLLLRAEVFAQHGYPFNLVNDVTYTLDTSALRVTHNVRNESAERAPIAIGAHPYLRVGNTKIDDLSLSLRVGTEYLTNDKKIPVNSVPLTSERRKALADVRVAELNLDTAFGELERDLDGNAVHRLSAPDGSWTELWQDENFKFVQLFTTDQYPSSSQSAGQVGRAIAIEPMTAVANAFNSGEGLRWLGPGESWECSWGIRYGRG
ncbi:MAG: aldose 1-epimerase family protein [Cryobacterium sp.]|nr:aldose 1-epimerase family protein [Cryobacterium sp.]MBX3104892.1 aldose 1-epimerase family protein [Cryobacterium sp.]